MGRAEADALADRERNAARATAAQGAKRGATPDAAAHAELVAGVLDEGGPVADFLRERGVDAAALEQFQVEQPG